MQSVSQMTVPQEVVTAAAQLIARLQARPQMHSVYVETGVADGEFVHTLVCSIHPKAPHVVRDRVPASVGGYPVRIEPWPQSMAVDADVNEIEALRSELRDTKAALAASSGAVVLGKP